MKKVIYLMFGELLNLEPYFFKTRVKCKYTQNAGSFKAADILCYNVQQVVC